MAIPRGSHYEPGSGRKYVRLGDGSLVPRATAENMLARERGYRSNYERRSAFGRSRRSKRYEQERERARERGVSRPDFDEARARLYADYQRAGGNYRDIDRSPDGPLANYLEAMGRRQSGADYNVGETPSVK
jgi:hypothetical protein